jgi:hypothetical protein
MLNYESQYGRLPPAVVYGKDGHALYSWRVLILPYLDQKKLYDEFALDEPWNSPHNLPLLQQRPQIYAPSPRRAKLCPTTNTFCRVFVGPGTPFEDREGQDLSTFTHGTSNTWLIVEAGPSVPWTMPEGIEYAPEEPLPEFTPIFPDFFRSAFADGSRHHVSTDLGEKTFRTLISRNAELTDDFRQKLGF